MKARLEDKETAVWLLNLANDMRKRKGNQKIVDLPPSIPQDTDRCIIANAFNYGCSVDPDSGIIDFQTVEDRDTYLNVMNIEMEKDFPEWLEDEYGDEPNKRNDFYLNATIAPMTNQLIEIAEMFDSGDLFTEYRKHDPVNAEPTF